MWAVVCNLIFPSEIWPYWFYYAFNDQEVQFPWNAVVHKKYFALVDKNKKLLLAWRVCFCDDKKKFQLLCVIDSMNSLSCYENIMDNIKNVGISLFRELASSFTKCKTYCLIRIANRKRQFVISALELISAYHFVTCTVSKMSAGWRFHHLDMYDTCECSTMGLIWEYTLAKM